ncbi:hypothetical protein QTI66_06735 [Variovorax sp. J22R133]|uniref:hypothetical protein n=1 Tax=Variovorax brevis TaxID=3053503 RepID=UPI002577574E|nr:hypothetical protein [Variovorax sp. J22R133]MDM0111840.1 hypothetical protein [Variovorax sp. J22R133]
MKREVTLRRKMRGVGTNRVMRVFRAAALGVALASPLAAGAADDPTQLSATATQPRAFGYQVGDLVSREVTVHAPTGLELDETSLPKAGVRGKALELRSVGHRSSAEAGGRRHELTLAYQVFLSPAEPRTLEMPGFSLRFKGQPRDQEVEVEAWPVTVSPLVPVDVSPRRGLGELQPDAPPPLIDTRFARYRLMAYGVVALAMLAYLAHVYIGLPWWGRAHRPFTQAWRSVRGLTAESPESAWRAAYQALHQALNRTMGEVVFEQGVERFVKARPRFGHLRGDLVAFFERSRAEFFGDAAKATGDRAWLVEFCRRCRDAERGAA